MNSLLTFCGQVFIIQSNSLFYPKKFGQRLSASPLPFILISVNPFAKRKSVQNRLTLLDDILLFLMWLQLIATPLFHDATCFVNHTCLMCNANAYVYSLLYLYVSIGGSPFSC